MVSTQPMILGFVVPTTEISTKLPVGEEVVAWATGVLRPLRWERLNEWRRGESRGNEMTEVQGRGWYSRDLPVLTAIAEKLKRGSAPVDTEPLIDELGLTRQDLTAALRALDVEYLIVRWPERSRTAAATLRLS